MAVNIPLGATLLADPRHQTWREQCGLYSSTGRFLKAAVTCIQSAPRRDVLHLSEVYDRRYASNPPWRLREAGEVYVRSLFKELRGLYGDVRQKGRLGNTGVGDLKGADMLVTEKASNTRFAISVKNDGYFMGERDAAISYAIDKATVEKAPPWLVVSFASRRTRAAGIVTPQP